MIPLFTLSRPGVLSDALSGDDQRLVNVKLFVLKLVGAGERDNRLA